MNLEEECNLCIDYLRKERGLKPEECLMVLHFLLDSFPKGYAIIEGEFDVKRN